ncbi:minor capsid protein [Listeria booriae]|uniref:minor capsid protein n=1 Tax=Listeria booriae TaxID=1552123 RepID=UPI0016266558|nr:minor capsid protein [Listeria booriae]MBC1892424.1 capsid protein [Listeria booriae]MBC1974559.1 capsid protein [Listeria booriae]MBC1983491.1 capsid protein [Listeria booriae]MBC2031851.1 capsid protein [Listeria booriae]
MATRVKVTQNLSGVYKKLSKANMKKCRHALANQVMSDSDQFVPALNYDLRNSAVVATDGSSIFYNAPYAKRQYKYKAKRYTTAGTGDHWDEKAESKYKKTWGQVIVRAGGFKS